MAKDGVFGIWDSERLSILLKDTQLLRSKGWIEIQVVSAPKSWILHCSKVIWPPQFHSQLLWGRSHGSFFAWVFLCRQDSASVIPLCGKNNTANRSPSALHRTTKGAELAVSPPVACTRGRIHYQKNKRPMQFQRHLWLSLCLIQGGYINHGHLPLPFGSSQSSRGDTRVHNAWNLKAKPCCGQGLSKVPWESREACD